MKLCSFARFNSLFVVVEKEASTLSKASLTPSPPRSLCLDLSCERLRRDAWAPTSASRTPRTRCVIGFQENGSIGKQMLKPTFFSSSSSPSFSLSLFSSSGHRRRLGPRGHHNARRRRRRGRFSRARDRHRRPTPRRRHDVPRLREAGRDGKAAERGAWRGVGPLDCGPVGLPARVLRVEDRLLRVEEEGGVLFRGHPSGVKKGGREHEMKMK